VKSIQTQNFRKTAARTPPPDVDLTPAERQSYDRLDELYEQAAELRDNVNKQLGQPDLDWQLKQRLEVQLDNAEARVRSYGDQLYRLCEKARKRKLNPPQPKAPPTTQAKWLSKVVRRFGYTSDVREAGYIHPNGQLISLSGRDPNQRSVGVRGQDHRAVASGIPELEAVVNDGNSGGQSRAMRIFMAQTKAVRIHCNDFYLLVDLAAVPTKQQVNSILRLAREMETVHIDARMPGGEEFGEEAQRNMPERAIPQYAIQDILRKAIQHLGPEAPGAGT
jgi:hypothetical protein